MKTFVYDEFNPEDIAMMQALYSRSAESVVEHAEKVKKTGSGKFMEKFYVGYGHASIADCGSTTVFIEGVSMLVAKAVQDWPLYSGQETSSRYIDFAQQEIVDPLGTPESKKIIQNWIDFYSKSKEPLIAYLQKRYPCRPEEDENVYLKAITARSFDILRSFLPAGSTTQLSWHTNLRQAADKLALMRYNPLPEVRAVAESIHQALSEKYPNSFSHKNYEEQENYRQYLVENFTFYNPKVCNPNFIYSTTIDVSSLSQYKDILAKRPIKTNLPHFLTELGTITFEFLMDFGSFRDIQRHRNGVCRMPLLTPQCGFNDWYLNQLPDDLMLEALTLIKNQTEAIQSLSATDEIKQYYVAMGFNTPCKVTYGLPATVYTVELRSGKLVHPTLRKIAHQMHYGLKTLFPDLVLHSDLELDSWDVRRGLSDIKEK
jgi:thymidylate synthase ThyX